MLAKHNLHGLRVLVIEDEPIIALMLEDVLSELGCGVVGPASSLQQAFDIVHSQKDIDVAILDVRLGEQSAFPIANELAKRGTPLVFSSGMGAEGLPHEWRGHPAILKPATLADVAAGLQQAFEGHAATQTGARVAAGILGPASLVPCEGND